MGDWILVSSSLVEGSDTGHSPKSVQDFKSRLLTSILVSKIFNFGFWLAMLIDCSCVRPLASLALTPSHCSVLFDASPLASASAPVWNTLLFHSSSPLRVEFVFKAEPSSSAPLSLMELWLRSSVLRERFWASAFAMLTALSSPMEHAETRRWWRDTEEARS